jgi:hypothetical protein
MANQKTTGLQPTNSQILSLRKSALMQTNDDTVSIYHGELTQQGIIDGVKAIKKAFPSLPVDFYDILIDRLRVNGFSDDRFIDSVVYVIDTCVYPTPTIANFIAYDKRIPSITITDSAKIR